MSNRHHVCRASGLALLFVWLFVCAGCGNRVEESSSGELRLVSLAPSLTEILFSLGLGDQVVADTVYCVTPEAAKSLPKVGAWTDVNVEQVLSFKPTHICLSETHPRRHDFERLGVGVVAVKGQTLSDVLYSIRQLGEAFGKTSEAVSLVSGIEERMSRLRAHQEGKRPFRALVVISRPHGEGQLREMTVAGDDGYYSELLQLSGCEQVPQGLGIPYPSLSVEGVVSLDPDVIIEIAPTMSALGEAGRGLVVSDWSRVLPELRAVTSHRILVFTENWATVPGLRSVRFAEELSAQIDAIRERDHE